MFRWTREAAAAALAARVAVAWSGRLVRGQLTALIHHLTVFGNGFQTIARLHFFTNSLHMGANGFFANFQLHTDLPV